MKWDAPANSTARLNGVRQARWVATAIWGLVLAAGTAPAQSPAQVAAALERLTTASPDSPWGAIRRFYEGRGFEPVWTDSGALRDFRRILGDAPLRGLDPADYRLASVEAAGDPDTLASLDVNTTFVLFRYVRDLTLGRVEPDLVDTMWSASSRRPDPRTLVGSVMKGGHLDRALSALGPTQPGALEVEAALARYQRLADQGGWPAVRPGAALALGTSGPRVARLRARLYATGDLATADSLGRFDAGVDSAVRHFQARHGLQVDGIVGPLTLAQLDVPAGARARQLALNLERWRWLPSELGRRYLMVNSAAYELTLVDTGGVDTFAVIVGRTDWPTPIVSAAVTEMLFNPRWNIPRSIALAEVIPAQVHDSTYMARQGIHVLSDTTDRARELDPDSVDWRAQTESTFALRLWMAPGPGNPLGRLRLGVPNRFNVALHDTPDTGLFAEPARTFSHGCVRVAGIARLATILVRDLGFWPADSIQATLAWPDERRVRLPRAIPVYFVYWTAWVDPDGTVQFRPDLYGWDAELERAIRERARLEPAHAR